MNTTANCCSNPQLRIIEALPDDSNAKMSVQRCDTCQTYWEVVADQVISERGETLAWDWFQQLRKKDALEILDCLAEG